MQKSEAEAERSKGFLEDSVNPLLLIPGSYVQGQENGVCMFNYKGSKLACLVEKLWEMVHFAHGKKLGLSTGRY